MTDRDEEIHVRGRIYTFSRHLRNNIHRHPEATKENVEHVLLDPVRQEPEGNRRFIYWGYLSQMGQFMIVVEDRLPTGEYQVLSAYCPVQQPTREEIYGRNTT